MGSRIANLTPAPGLGSGNTAFRAPSYPAPLGESTLCSLFAPWRRVLLSFLGRRRSTNPWSFLPRSNSNVQVRRAPSLCKVRTGRREAAPGVGMVSSSRANSNSSMRTLSASSSSNNSPKGRRYSRHRRCSSICSNFRSTSSSNSNLGLARPRLYHCSPPLKVRTLPLRRRGHMSRRS